jgi:hypothetical protein
MLLSDYILQVRELIHDLSGNDWTDQELTVAINNARQRVALDTHCVRNLIINLQAFTPQETYPMQGGVGGVNITNGGTGYGSAPTVTFTPTDGNGTGAAATAVITSGKVTAVNMTSWGSGYTAVPTVSFSSGAAAATAIVPLDVIDILAISVIWGLMRYTLNWLPWTPFQAFCRANTTNLSRPGIWTAYEQMQIVYLYPIPDQPYIMEWDTISLPMNLVNSTDYDSQVLLPYADGVQFYAAHLALLKLQNFAQAEYMNRKYDARVRQILNTRQDRRDPNVYRTWWRRMNRM